MDPSDYGTAKKSTSWIFSSKGADKNCCIGFPPSLGDVQINKMECPLPVEGGTPI